MMKLNLINRNRIFFKRIILLFLVIYSVTCVSQSKSERSEAYNSAVRYANDLFNNGQFIESIIYYKEALVLDPKGKLPVYRIEDIKTIYIQRELVLRKKPDEVGKFASKKKKEEQEAARAALDKEIRDKVEGEIAAFDNKDFREKVKLIIEEKEKEYTVSDSSKESLALAKKVRLEKLDQAVRKFWEEEAKKNDTLPAIPVDNLPISTAIAEKTYENTTIGIPVEQEAVTLPDQQDTSGAAQSSKKTSVGIQRTEAKVIVTEKAMARQAEEERLKTKYIEPRTVEVVEDAGKKTTRVIMNHEGKITIYLKVEHSWGGVYYFIDYTPDELQTISQNYFDSHTKVDKK